MSERLSAEDLAERASVSVERVAELVGLGLLDGWTGPSRSRTSGASG